MNDSNGMGFYIPGALLLVAAGLKLPALCRNPRDELLRSVCILLALATAVFGFTAIPTLIAVNRITGVPNAAAPVVFSLLTAFSGANIVLIFRWSSGPEDSERTRRRSRLCNVVTLAVIAAINVLFALGDAPVERLRDLDTYYASTPYIREMILLYLAAHTTAAVTMTLLCWRWAREVHGALRAGLGLIAVGYVLNLLYDIAKFTAIGARWAGGSHDWDVLSTEIAPDLASVSALLIATGFILPLISQHLTSQWDMWRRYCRLRHLSRELQGVTRHGIELATGPWASIEIRLTQRESDIHDGILTVSPYLHAGLREQALREELEAGRPADEAAAVADAAALASAVVRWNRAQGAPDEPAPKGAGPVLTSPNSPLGLVRMSRALAESDTVRSFRRT